MWIYVVIFILLIVAKHIFFSAEAIGKRGESKVAAILAALPKEYLVLNNIIITNQDGTTSQIDHLVVSPYGIFVIETKNYKGWIVGSETGKTWTKVMYKHRYEFENPLRQNYGHVKAVAAYLGLRANQINHIVVFGNRANIKVHIEKDCVINMYDLRKTITSCKATVFTAEDLKRISEILENKKTATKEETNEHVKEVKERIRQNNQMVSAGICPKCGGQLIRRKGKYGMFLGCGNYPQCRFTQDIVT